VIVSASKSSSRLMLAVGDFYGLETNFLGLDRVFGCGLRYERIDIANGGFLDQSHSR
jgi:hypothetical protein